MRKLFLFIIMTIHGGILTSCSDLEVTANGFSRSTVVTDLGSLSAKPGEVVTFTGRSFTDDMTADIDGQAIAITINDSENGSFTIPADMHAGLLRITFKKNDQVVARMPLLAGNANDTLQITPIPLAYICDTYILKDQFGNLVRGEGKCDPDQALPTCTIDGQTNCIANEDAPSALKLGLSVKVLTGQTAAGVLGSAPLRPVDCSSDGMDACVVDGTNYKAAKLVNYSGTDIRTGVVIGGVAGVLSGVTPACGTDGATNCLANNSFPSIDKANSLIANASKMKSDLTLLGVTGTLANCSSEGQGTCVADGLSFKAMDPSTAANKIIFGQSIGGVSGNVTLPAVARVLTGTNYGISGTNLTGSLTLPAAADVRMGSANFGITGSLVTPTYSPDFPLASNVRSTDTVNGSAGTLNDCTAANQSGCVATSTFKTMNLSLLGTDTGITSGNFNSTIKTASNFEFWDGSGNRHSVAGDADLVSANIASGINIFGNAGSAVVETHSACTAANQTGCLSTSTYRTMDLSAATAMTDLTLTNLNSTLATVGNFEFWDSLGNRYQGVGSATLTAANIVSGATIFGVAGSVTGTPPACSANGSQSCVATGSYFAATACSANSSNCYLPTYVAATQPLKAISYDAIDAGKASIRASLTLSGVVGTLSDCSLDGESGCVVIGPTYAALLKTGAQDKIVSGHTIGSVAGNVTLPAVGKVYSGINYGVSGNGLTGTLTLPVVSNVKTGTSTYGDPGSALTPSYSPDFPAVTNVLSSATVNGSNGTLTLPTAAKVLTGTSYGVAGNGSTGSLTLPAANKVLTGSPSYGETGSLTVPTYSPDFPPVTHVLSGFTVNGSNGTLTLPTAAKVLTGASYGVAGNGSTGSLTLPAANKVLTGSPSFGETGSLTVPSYSPDFPLASNVLTGSTVNGSNGTLTLPAAAKVLTPTSYGVGGNGSTGSLSLPAADKVLTGSPSYGETGSLTVPSYTPDFPAPANVRSSVTVNGVSGTLADCSAANQSGCVSTSTYKTMDLSSASVMTDLTNSNFNTTIATAANFEFWDSTGGRHQVAGDADLIANNIVSGIIIHGVTGTRGAESHSNCSADNTTGCVAIAAFKAVDSSKLTADVVKNGFAVGGVSGLYPSATYPLSGNTATQDLTNATFNAYIKVNASFEYFDSAGNLQTTSGNANLVDTNIKNGVTMFGTTGNFAAPCTADGIVSCLTTTTYKSVDTSALTTWDIRLGKTAGAIAGSLALYNSGADLTTYNRLTGTGSTNSTTVADIYDTIDDVNSSKTYLPSTMPSGYAGAGSNLVRDSASDTDASTTCNNVEACVYIDKITNLYWSKDDTTARTWDNTIIYCDGLTYGGYNDWRVPTQKEFLQAYINGITLLRTPLSLTISASEYYWTGSTASASGGNNSYRFGFWGGTMTYNAKTDTYRGLCVR